MEPPGAPNPMLAEGPQDVPGAGLHSTNYKEAAFSVAASQAPPREELRIDLHTLVRTLAYEAAMIRLCRDLIIYWFWLILAILCVTCDSPQACPRGGRGILLAFSGWQCVKAHDQLSVSGFIGFEVNRKNSIPD